MIWDKQLNYDTSDYERKSCGTRRLCEQNPTLELVARRNWPSYMFKDGKHELYSTTRTQIVSRSLKQRIIQRSYYRLLLCD